jgi:tRNA threonylcarbamoyladenosine biosynthesis protein TsaE
MMIRKPPCGNHALDIKNLEELKRLAHFFSKTVTSGDFVALTGALGAGKTTFTRFFCEAIRIEQPITSPTFTLLNEYHVNGMTILHGDLYRLDDTELLSSLPEMEEQFETPNSMVLMEWADKAPQISYRWTWHLDFSFHSNESAMRVVVIETNKPDKLQQLLEMWSS